MELGNRRRSTPGPTWPASTSPVPTSKRRSGRCPAANATGFTWPSCSSPAATCCCWTSRPTTWTSTPCAPWKRRCSISPARPSSSPMIAGSWTGSATHILAFEGDSQVYWYPRQLQRIRDRPPATAGRGRRSAPSHHLPQAAPRALILRLQIARHLIGIHHF
jgi:hypothetical protein